MKASRSQSPGSNRYLVAPLISSLAITMFLAYIDEGFYNFNWMLNWSNWIAFLVYFSIIFSVQLVILVLFRKLFSKRKSPF